MSNNPVSIDTFIITNANKCKILCCCIKIKVLKYERGKDMRNKKIQIIVLIMIITILIVISFNSSLVRLSLCLLLLGYLELFIINYIISNIISKIDDYIVFNALKKRTEDLSEEELEIVNDAKNLIKIVNSNITIKEFNVYKVSFFLGAYGMFCYSENNELNIFIPFDKLISNRDHCLFVVLHEILHSQNLKNNKHIFKIVFLENINDLLSKWLIETYSNKYEMDEEYIYDNEGVNFINKLIMKSGLSMEEVFMNYINLNPAFFRNFIPEKYFYEN